VAALLRDPKLLDCPVEGVLVRADTPQELALIGSQLAGPEPLPAFLILEPGPALGPDDLATALPTGGSGPPVAVLRQFGASDAPDFARWVDFTKARRWLLAAAVLASDLPALAPAASQAGAGRILFTLGEGFRACASGSSVQVHSLGAYRSLAEALLAAGIQAPVWIRNTPETAVRGDNSFLSRLLEASILTGGLLCDGIGDLLSIETEGDPARAARLAYNVLQGAGARISKTEFVACPSCGRTLFDLQETTQRIRSQTGHLKGVKIAIMGCIVNGPGEMADADFGYVGGAPGKINLYVGKQCVQYNIPQADADARLMALIKEHGRWVEPALPD
jgi:(E)-4-hydroxy-3-methylbut-2-enyl-diphosphate synthase